jgi:hypothetical protein
MDTHKFQESAQETEKKNRRLRRQLKRLTFCGWLRYQLREHLRAVSLRLQNVFGCGKVEEDYDWTCRSDPCPSSEPEEITNAEMQSTADVEQPELGAFSQRQQNSTECGRSMSFLLHLEPVPQRLGEAPESTSRHPAGPATYDSGH